MRYLAPEERKDNQEVEEYLGNYISQSIKHNFSLKTLQKYQPDKTAKILDAGCASGAFLKQLAEDGYQNLYGVDLDNYVGKGIQLKDFKKADFNMSALPYPDNYFDAITAWCVLTHLENPYHFIREIKRILKEGGVFIATLPHIGSKAEKQNFYRKGEFIAYKPNNDHITIWTPSLLEKTTSPYFEKIGEEFLLKNKIFKGFKGLIRRWYYKLNPTIANQWGSKIAYILQKKKNPF